MSDASAIAKDILSRAIGVGGDTWGKIEKSAPLYINSYAQGLVDIAAGVSAGEISEADAKMYVANARLLLAMGIANTSEIVLSEAQQFMDDVLAALTQAINAALPVPLL